MSIFSKILKLFLRIIGLGKKPEDSSDNSVVYESRTEPKYNRIAYEPVLAIKDDELVMVVQHQFQNIPSWVEWDKDRQVVTIAHMNGDIDEADLELKEEHLERLKKMNKVLLVSNDKDDKIVHYVQFLTRL